VRRHFETHSTFWFAAALRGPYDIGARLAPPGGWRHSGQKDGHGGRTSYRSPTEHPTRSTLPKALIKPARPSQRSS